MFQTSYTIRFGDCDPAGIVFYPNYLRWFDGTFHALLRSRGKGHQEICAGLDVVGMGLMEVGAKFRSPATDGDTLTLSVEAAEWGDRSVRFAYQGHVDGRLVLDGFEVRGLFVRDGERLKLSPVAPLKAYLDQPAIT
jgi:4-hydroxybenzoyl-CoA thioesterase